MKTLKKIKEESKINDEYINNLICLEGYKYFNNINLNNQVDSNFLKEKFYCHLDLDEFNKIPIHKKHIVTGFGPTNAPTAGTLSIILKTILINNLSGIDTTIIISELGAFNSRNVELKKLLCLTDRFKSFIRKIGFSGEIRTQNDIGLLRASAVTSKVFLINDVSENLEITSSLYKQLGLEGNDFSNLYDANLCIADILLPILKNKKEAVLVLAGIEEYFLPKIARTIADRLNKNYLEIIGGNKIISALFSKVISGLNGYPKMSKSIPESSINLEEKKDKIADKILNCKTKDEKIILQMMIHVSNWDKEKIKKTKKYFLSKNKEWKNAKKEYLEFFLNIKSIWDSTKFDCDKFDFKF